MNDQIRQTAKYKWIIAIEIAIIAVLVVKIVTTTSQPTMPIVTTTASTMEPIPLHTTLQGDVYMCEQMDVDTEISINDERINCSLAQMDKNDDEISFLAE